MDGDAAWTFNPSEGKGHGIGYSRLCIQLVAFLLGLDFVWVLDDTVNPPTHTLNSKPYTPNPTPYTLNPAP